ncbi:hypothetical protein [uncultured Nostoc sp.]|uniref:hypothetical protein n=1 Tax=uncultured Nostoc sp. TaxID=340711 RepID=UPI0035CC2911
MSYLPNETLYRWFRQFKLYLHLSTMPNPKGKPENFDNPPSKDLTDQLSFRVTKEMKEEVKSKDDPPQFCRDAIQEKLDREK